jgi:hypothetical protein
MRTAIPRRAESRDYRAAMRLCKWRALSRKVFLASARLLPASANLIPLAWWEPDARPF